MCRRCDCCGAEAVETKFYEAPAHLHKKHLHYTGDNLCTLCAGTATGNAHLYPDQYRGQVQILKTICFVGNEIIKALRPEEHAP